MRKKIYPFILALLALQVITGTIQAQGNSYQKEMAEWRQKREQELMAPGGWLNLAGLFWLQPGKNSFGSAKSNDIVFEHKDMPAVAGYFERNGNDVKWITQKGVSVTVRDSVVNEMLIFQAGNFRAPLLALSHFRWSLIKRDDKIGVRFRDLESPALKAFHGVAHYPVDSNWRVNAVLEPAAKNLLSITNVLGQTSELATPGKLVFHIGTTEYKLDAIEEARELFIVFGDATSGNETYPAGRFIYVEKPGADGKTYIDFNKAHNPPCAFTLYATCPLPPKQNILPVKVTAGEKDYDHK